MKKIILAIIAMATIMSMSCSTKTAQKNAQSSVVILKDTLVHAIVQKEWDENNRGFDQSELLAYDTMYTFLTNHNPELKASAEKTALATISWVDRSRWLWLHTTKNALTVLNMTWGDDSLARFVRQKFASPYNFYIEDVASDGLKAKIKEMALAHMSLTDLDQLLSLDIEAVRTYVKTMPDSELVKYCGTNTVFTVNDSIIWKTVAKRLTDTSLCKLVENKSFIAKYVPVSRRNTLLHNLRKQDLWSLEYLSEWEYTPCGCNWYYGTAKKLFLQNLKIDTTLDMYGVIRLWWKRSVLDDKELTSVLKAKTLPQLLEATKQLEGFNTFANLKEDLYMGLIAKVHSKKDYTVVAEFFAERKESGYLTLLKQKS